MQCSVAEQHAPHPQSVSPVAHGLKQTPEAHRHPQAQGRASEHAGEESSHENVLLQNL